MVVMTNEEKKSAYELMLAQAKVLFANEDNALANFSNASALLNTTLPNSVFTGFYLMDNVKNELILGPFQGNAARSEIVVPMVKDGKLVGVLDLDSHQVGDYNDVDQDYLEAFVKILLEKTELTFGMFEVN